MDPNRFSQVMVNLLINSAQALKTCTDRPKEIRISTWTADDGSAVVEVSDNGCGIAAEHIDRVFEPFFTTKPIGLGTGLGLSVCHGIVKSLGGDIVIESTQGVGTTIRVTLPAALATPHLEVAAGA